MTSVTLVFPSNQLRRIDKIGIETSLNRSSVIRLLISEALKARKK